MPTYDYKCNSCGAVKEKLFSITEEILQFIDCECGQSMQKQVSLPVIIFKGSGFASNDLKKGDKNEYPTNT